MAKYEKWVLKEKQLVPLGNCITTTVKDGQTFVMQGQKYIFACPHCNQEYAVRRPSEFRMRRCRVCHKNVSPYGGEILEDIWLPYKNDERD